VFLDERRNKLNNEIGVAFGMEADSILIGTVREEVAI
jgi:hypothetical protein